MSPPSALTAVVRALCAETLAVLAPGDARALVERVHDKLGEPLRIAVAGSVSSGKSTLVNALLGQRVAEVDAGECTRVVTWYRHGHHERAELVLTGGERRTVPLEPGPRVPRALGVDPARVAHLVVWLSNERLRTASIIDTPGLDTVTRANQAASASFLGTGWPKEGRDTRTAMSQADALIFLMPHARAVDADTLAAFQALFRGAGLSAVNAVGVLSKVDRLVTPEEDPWPPARRIAERVAGELRAVVSAVIPVMGLLAETAQACRLTERDAQALHRLAGLDPLDLADALLDGAGFLDLPDAVAARTDRVRLLEMLDLYGLRICTDALRSGPGGVAALRGRLDEVSGYGRLERLVAEVFTRRADLLKAHAGICDLVRISYRHGDTTGDGRRLRALRDPLERLQLNDRLHDLRVLEALRCVGEGTLVLPDELTRDLEQLALGATPASRLGLWAAATRTQVADAAALRARRWGAYANDLRRSPSEERLARDVKTAYELLFGATTARSWWLRHHG